MNQLPTYLTITNQPYEVLDKLIKKWNPDRIAILVDENTKQHCLPNVDVTDYLLVEIPSGEENKTIETCEYVWTKLTSAQMTRNSLLINLGGGVIGDLGGFSASTFKRGIRFINLPTTLLSQVDASIGGKLGVDFGELKNHIGIFKEPDHVIVNPDFLSTLSERELRSGFAEVIKHSLVADKEQWDFLKTCKFKNLVWDKIIPHSISIKNRIVSSDPTEKGLRKILNFGHTMGHALESYFLNTSDKILHGEAIAIGMILESHLSLQKGWLGISEYDTIKNFIHLVFSLPKALPRLDHLHDFLLQDKKNNSRGINFSIINEIGNCEYDVRISEEMIEKSISSY